MDSTMRNKLLRVLAITGIVLALFGIEILKRQGALINPDTVLTVVSISFIAWVISCYKR